MIQPKLVDQGYKIHSSHLPVSLFRYLPFWRDFFSLLSGLQAYGLEYLRTYFPL